MGQIDKISRRELSARRRVVVVTYQVLAFTVEFLVRLVVPEALVDDVVLESEDRIVVLLP